MLYSIATDVNLYIVGILNSSTVYKHKLGILKLFGSWCGWWQKEWSELLQQLKQFAWTYLIFILVTLALLWLILLSFSRSDKLLLNTIDCYVLNSIININTLGNHFSSISFKLNSHSLHRFKTIYLLARTTQKNQLEE